MVRKKIGDQLLSSLIILDFSKWYSAKCLVDSEYQLDVSLSCDESRNEVPCTESQNCDEIPRAKSSECDKFPVATTRGTAQVQASLFGAVFRLGYRRPSNRRVWSRVV